MRYTRRSTIPLWQVKADRERCYVRGTLIADSVYSRVLIKWRSLRSQRPVNFLPSSTGLVEPSGLVNSGIPYGWKRDRLIHSPTPFNLPTFSPLATESQRLNSSAVKYVNSLGATLQREFDFIILLPPEYTIQYAIEIKFSLASREVNVSCCILFFSISFRSKLDVNCEFCSSMKCCRDFSFSLFLLWSKMIYFYMGIWYIILYYFLSIE